MNKRSFLVVLLFAGAWLVSCGGSGSSSATTFTVGGTISGISGTVVLQNNAGDNLSLTTGDTTFTFATALANAAAYAVTVLTEPAGLSCTVTNGTGTISGANVTNVSITCSGACSSGEIFSQAPVDLADITSMGVLGTLVPPDHTFPTPHLYFYVMNASGGGGESNVYAPADITATTIVYKYRATCSGAANCNDFDIYFQVCDEMKMYFIHVASITQPDMVAAMAAGNCPSSGEGRSFEECHLTTNIELSAGEAIGTTGQQGVAYGMDVGVRDYRLSYGRSAFVDPDRWCSADNPSITEHCYTVCFFDYLGAATAEGYLAKFEEQDVQRTEEPRCGGIYYTLDVPLHGSIYYDVAGSARGYWFPTAETPTTEANDFYVGPDSIVPSKYSFSIGSSSINPDHKVYIFNPSDSGLVNRKFGDITDTEIYCYDHLYDSIYSAVNSPSNTMSFIFLLRLSADFQSLTFEKQSTASSCGSGPWAFGSSSVTFVR